MLFDIPKRSTREQDMALAKKANSVKKAIPTVRGGGSIVSRIQNIVAMVETKLGKYKDRYILIREEQDLIDYIDKCIENKCISIDTETTGLDPLQDDIVGVCIYTPNEKGAYIPINHISYITQEKANNQLSVEFVRSEFERLLEHKPEIIMFNAAFDIRFMRNQVGVKDIYCTWDAYLAARCLNENEPTNGLKPLHEKYVLNGEGDAWGYGSLFNGITFNLIPIKTAYLYAARDPEITYELYMYQKQYLRDDIDREDLRNVYWVFKNIEMPCIKVVCDMEDTGIEFDFNYNEKLKEKYHALLEEKLQAFYDCCKAYSREIEACSNTKLDNPINISSPTQLAILLYDIIKVEVPNLKKSGTSRPTGEEALKKIGLPICDAILEYRTAEKLVNTYIDKLPECVNPDTGRIHCKFNQYGADTGRMSSSDPNLQNIPSHNKDIRKMFKATNDEEVLTTEDDIFTVYRWDEVYTKDGWVSCSKLKVGDDLDGCIIKSIELQDDNYKIVV